MTINESRFMAFVHDAVAMKSCEGLGFKLKKRVVGEANTEFVFMANV